jgi:hypothetical protein
MAEEEAHAARTMVNWRRVVCSIASTLIDKFPKENVFTAVPVCVYPSRVLLVSLIKSPIIYD